MRQNAHSNDTGNISVSLALSLFDKQIAPILLYGCPILAMPSNFRSVSLQNVPENIPLRPFLENLCNMILNKNLNIINCQRMGRINDKAPRKVLINFDNYLDAINFKEIINTNSNSNYISNTFTEGHISDSLETFHWRFLTYVLGVNKYASNIACRGKLGRYSLINKAKALAEKYWARLEKTTSNLLINCAYQTMKRMELRWLQSIYFTLDINGLTEIKLNSQHMSLGRLKSTYLNRLNDQYAQNWQASVSSSSRLQFLSELKKDFNISKYLLNIRDPLIRKTFTRLRIDLNILQECKSRQNTTDSNNTTCPLCHSSNETVSQFLNECNDNELTNHRIHFKNLMLSLMPEFGTMSNAEKLQVILNLKNVESNSPVLGLISM